MTACVACGHAVVAWHPEDSEADDDLVCYNCGLHANSVAAEQITALSERLSAFEKVGRQLLDGHKLSSFDWKAFRDLESLLAQEPSVSFTGVDGQ